MKHIKTQTDYLKESITVDTNELYYYFNDDNERVEEGDDYSVEELYGYKISVTNTYGYALGVYDIDTSDATLDILSVSDEYQGKGYSKELLLGFIKEAKNMGASKVVLEVESTNNKRLNDDELITFYKKMGFEGAGRHLVLDLYK